MTDITQSIERLEEVLSVPFPPTVWPVARQDIRALLDEVTRLREAGEVMRRALPYVDDLATMERIDAFLSKLEGRS